VDGRYISLRPEGMKSRELSDKIIGGGWTE
jgi:hypothetical protein